MSYNYRSKEKVKNVQNKVIYLFKVLYYNVQNSNLMPFSITWNMKPGLYYPEQKTFSGLWRVLEINKQDQFRRFNYWSILMYYYLLPQKGWSWLIFLDQSKALGALAPIASSVGRSERRWASPTADCPREPCRRTGIWYTQ